MDRSFLCKLIWTTDDGAPLRNLYKEVLGLGGHLRGTTRLDRVTW